MNLPSTPHIRFVPMTSADLVTVDVLEQLCFPTPWSMTTYRRELQHNRFSHYWVVRPQILTQQVGQTPNTARDKALNTAQNGGHDRRTLPPILAYGGYWILGDDAHIATIASHPEWRRCGLAKWLLLNMLLKACQQGVFNATLEVRVSNKSAQKLYTGLGFQEVGRRKGYYPPSKILGRAEDALLLTLFGIDQGHIWRKLEEEYATVNSAVDSLFNSVLSQPFRGVQPQ